MTDEITFLVCARVGALFMALGSRFDYICERCFHRVQTAPTGQRFLANHPKARIICGDCYFADPELQTERIGIAASIDKVIGEIISRVPSPQGNRN